MRDEMLDQRRNILAPVGQRRDRDRDHVEPVIQIFAETTLGDFLGQIARGGGNDADIDLDDTLAADAGEALIGPPELGRASGGKECVSTCRSRGLPIY